MKGMKTRLSRREQIVSLRKMEKLKIDNLFQTFKNKKDIRYRPIVCW